MKPTPAGWPRLSSGIYYRDAGKAIDWLCEAFGFEVRLKVEGEGGSIVHSELAFGDGLVMVGESLGDRSRRFEGGTNVTVSAAAAPTSVSPSAVRIRTASSFGISIPRIRRIWANRNVIGAHSAGGCVPANTDPFSNSPPASSRISSQQRRLAHSGPCGSRARSKR